ncbi:MAG TPA: hypothetical protein VGJ01_04640 [Pseudolabrys sp.]|jgi:hypothetical protein
MSRLQDCAPAFVADEAAMLRHGTRDYLEKMSQELSEIAFKNGWDSLAVIFEMARQEAERMRRASDEHLVRP